MLDDAALASAIGKALAKLLRPLVKLLLKHSFPFAAFEAVAKRVYVEVAMEDFAIPGRKPSVSRASVLTGLNRKDVNAQLSTSGDYVDVAGAHYNYATRVLSQWVRDPEFHGPYGAPLVLPIEGKAGFAELVRKTKGDVPWRAVLDELERLGAVRVLADGSVQLLHRAFVPNSDAVPMFNILGSDVKDLVDTITYNIDRGDLPARYQRKVMHTEIPKSVLREFQAMSAKQAQSLLESWDKWLASRDLSNVPREEWPERARVGVGIYYFEELEHDEPGSAQ